MSGSLDERVLLRQSYYVARSKHSWIALELEGREDIEISS